MTACVCVIAALRGRLLCVMLYSLCKVERIVLTELNVDYCVWCYTLLEVHARKEEEVMCTEQSCQ